MWSISRSAITLALFAALSSSCRESEPSSSSVSEAESNGGLYEWSREPAVAASVEVTGRIVARSTPYLPDPAKSEYVDCLFSCEVEVLEIRSEEKTGRNILVMFPGFLERRMQPPASYLLGQILDLKLAAYASVPEPIAKLQVVDQIDDFEIERYFAVSTMPSARLAESFPARKADYFESDPGASSIATLPKPEYPRSNPAFEARAKVIAGEKKRLRADLARHGDDFDRWSAGLEPFYQELRSRQAEVENGELREGPLHFQRLRNANYAELCQKFRDGEPGPIGMLKNLSDQLRERAIDLIVVPLPFKEEVFADRFSAEAPEDGVFVPHRHQFLLELAEADVEILDLVPPMQRRLDEFPHLFYDAPDFHPAEGAIQIIADEIAERLKRYEFTKIPGYVPLIAETRSDTYQIERSANGLIAGAEYPATVVTLKDGGFFEAEGTRLPSPLVLMGDSCNTVPGNFSGDAAIPTRLAFESGVVADTLVNLGGSNRAMRMLAREGGDFLADRWVVVFVFAPSKLFGATAEFGADGGWDLIDLPPLRLD